MKKKRLEWKASQWKTKVNETRVARKDRTRKMFNPRVELIGCWLGGFYGISTHVDYLTPNPVDTFILNTLNIKYISGFNPRSRHTKDLKMVLDTPLLNTQQYKVHIKGKGEQFR